MGTMAAVCSICGQTEALLLHGVCSLCTDKQMYSLQADIARLKMIIAELPCANHLYEPLNCGRHGLCEMCVAKEEAGC